MEPITKSSEKKMMKVGDKVGHWNWGDGEVLVANPTQDEVPVEWKHDWQNVIMVQFWHLNNAAMWVLTVDLEKE